MLVPVARRPASSDQSYFTLLVAAASIKIKNKTLLHLVTAWLSLAVQLHGEVNRDSTPIRVDLFFFITLSQAAASLPLLSLILFVCRCWSSSLLLSFFYAQSRRLGYEMSFGASVVGRFAWSCNQHWGAMGPLWISSSFKSVSAGWGWPIADSKIPQNKTTRYVKLICKEMYSLIAMVVKKETQLIWGLWSYACIYIYLSGLLFSFQLNCFSIYKKKKRFQPFTFIAV